MSVPPEKHFLIRQVETPKKLEKNIMKVAVKCNRPECSHEFTVPSDELVKSNDLICPNCKKQFAPNFTESGRAVHGSHDQNALPTC